MARLWPFRRQINSQLPPPVTQLNQPTTRRWPVIAASIFAALVLVGLAVLAGLLIYHAANKTTSKKPNTASNSQSQSQTPSRPSGSTGTTGGGSQPSGSGGTSGSTSESQKKVTGGTSTSSTSGQVGKTLPNNGPGDVAAIFAGTSLVAAGLHYIIGLRRSNQSKA